MMGNVGVCCIMLVFSDGACWCWWIMLVNAFLLIFWNQLDINLAILMKFKAFYRHSDWTHHYSKHGWGNSMAHSWDFADTQRFVWITISTGSVLYLFWLTNITIRHQTPEGTDRFWGWYCENERDWGTLKDSMLFLWFIW